MSCLSVVKKFFPNVKAVVDSKTNARIEVTDADVKSSKLKNHKQCAMAVACKRKFHLDGVIIAKSVAYLVKGNKARRFNVPESVSREVVSFDRGAGFSAGDYALRAISPANRMDRPKREKLEEDRLHKGNPIEKRFQHKTDNVRASLSYNEKVGAK